jgi:hypothetical protein
MTTRWMLMVWIVGSGTALGGESPVVVLRGSELVALQEAVRMKASEKNDWVPTKYKLPEFDECMTKTSSYTAWMVVDADDIAISVAPNGVCFVKGTLLKDGGTVYRFDRSTGAYKRSESGPLRRP